MQRLGLFFVTILTVFVFDMIWLGYLAKQIYADNIGMLLRKSGEFMAPIWPAAIVVYIFIAIGILYFVLPKANGNYLHALLWGFLFGAVTYGIYDFTNYSILANWPLRITLIDFIWGITLCGITSLVVTLIQNRWISA